jgi:hypothetical protein
MENRIRLIRYEMYAQDDPSALGTMDRTDGAHVQHEEYILTVDDV